MTIEKVKIEEVKFNPNNPRIIKDDKFKKLVKSVKDFPEMLNIRPIVIDDDGIVLGGNMRLKACKEAGLKEISIIKASNLTEEQKREFIIKDNIGYGEWDWDLLLEDYDKETLIDWGMDMPKYSLKDECKVKLSERFIIPPFSILDSRQGDWITRKKLWNGFLKEDGESREGTLATGNCIMANVGVSLFDPVIAEIVFHWFCPENANIIDPFAGDIRKGAVAGFMKHNFTGIEIRKEQFDINKNQIERLELNNVKYINDTGCNISKYIKDNSQDLLFSCPPYYNLEKYSDMDGDASNQESYEDFIKILDDTFTSGIKTLKNDRFAAVVVGDLRNKDGYYYNFHEDIKYIFNKAGMPLYNELILIESGGSAAMRANGMMKNRKVVKTHQNVLVFYKPSEKTKIESVYRKIFIFHKGDPNNIKKDFKEIKYNNIDLPENIDDDLDNIFKDE